jgi:ribose-phosphate pyrophosphokinase
MDKVRIISGSSNQPLAASIAAQLGATFVPCNVKRFSDGEISVSLADTVRTCTCFVVQSTSQPVNDHLIEMLLIVDACKRDSARQVALIMPYFAYASQDRRQRDARSPISAKLVADLITAIGVNRAVVMDLYSDQVIASASKQTKQKNKRHPMTSPQNLIPKR